MRLAPIATAFALAAGLIVAPAIGAQAKEKDCGWTGDVVPLMQKADRKVRSERVTKRIMALVGKGAKIMSYQRMEVDLVAGPGQTTVPTVAATLSASFTTYNVAIKSGGTVKTISAQVRMDNMCYRTTLVDPRGWTGSDGTDKPLKVNADKALKLAQKYRVAHEADYPLSQPLHSMNLMQATTDPGDFGKLRWYVNYDTGQGGLNILAVYMDGKVTPILAP